MHFLITSGPTREYIDPVRFISNASSGKMGLALAGAALKAGHKVTLVVANVSQAIPEGVKIVKLQTAADMFEAVKKYFPKCDCLIMAAAVSDYTVVKISKTKIKKSGEDLVLRLKPTVDILKWAGQHKRQNQVVAGFALEDKELRVRAEHKLKEKKLDIIIANRPSAIGVDRTVLQVKIAGKKWLKFPRAAKTRVAEKIISLVEEQKS